jgi:hypothetical protein
MSDLVFLCGGYCYGAGFVEGVEAEAAPVPEMGFSD